MILVLQSFAHHGQLGNAYACSYICFPRFNDTKYSTLRLSGPHKQGKTIKRKKGRKVPRVFTSSIHGYQTTPLIIADDDGLCTAGLHVAHLVDEAAGASPLDECNPRKIWGGPCDGVAAGLVRALEGLDRYEVED